MSGKSSSTPRKYHLFFRFERDEGITWDKRVQNAMNAFTNQTIYSKTDAFSAIFQYGVEAIERDLRAKGELFPESEIALKLREIKAQNDEFLSLNMLYNEMGEDKFIEFMITIGKNWEEFLDRFYALKKENPPSWKEQAEEFLDELLRCGGMSTEQIKKAAIVAQILDDSTPEKLNTSWNRLQKHKSRAGIITNAQGEWELPPGKIKKESFTDQLTD